MKLLESLLGPVLLWMAGDVLSPFELFIPAFLLMAIAILFRSERQITTPYDLGEVTAAWAGPVFQNHPNRDRLIWIASILLLLLSLLAQFLQVTGNSGSWTVVAGLLLGYIGSATVLFLAGGIRHLLFVLVALAVVAGLAFSVRLMGCFNPILAGFVGLAVWVFWISEDTQHKGLSFMIIVGGALGVWFFLRYF